MMSYHRLTVTQLIGMQFTLTLTESVVIYVRTPHRHHKYQINMHLSAEHSYMPLHSIVLALTEVFSKWCWSSMRQQLHTLHQRQVDWHPDSTEHNISIN